MSWYVAMQNSSTLPIHRISLGDMMYYLINVVEEHLSTWVYKYLIFGITWRWCSREYSDLSVELYLFINRYYYTWYIYTLRCEQFRTKNISSNFKNLSIFTQKIVSRISVRENIRSEFHSIILREEHEAWDRSNIRRTSCPKYSWHTSWHSTIDNHLIRHKVLEKPKNIFIEKSELSDIFNAYPTRRNLIKSMIEWY